MEVSSFIVAEGCQAHDCPDRYALFVLDSVNKLAWAIEGTGDPELNESTKALIWGVLTPSDTVPMREITLWLDRHKVPQGLVTFVLLPDTISRLYKRPRQVAAEAETPQASASSSRVGKADIPAEVPAPPIQGIQNSAISLDKEGNTFLVPVAINGELTLKFTIDSGASDVSTPADVVLTLLRTGTLTHDDFLGTRTYRLADGSTIPSQTFQIRSLKVECHRKRCSCNWKLATWAELLE